MLCEEALAAARRDVPTPYFHQLKWLMVREASLVRANPAVYVRARFAKSMYQGLVLGLLFYDLEKDQKGLYSRTGLLYNSAGSDPKHNAEPVASVSMAAKYGRN